MRDYNYRPSEPEKYNVKDIALGIIACASCFVFFWIMFIMATN